ASSPVVMEVSRSDDISSTKTEPSLALRMSWLLRFWSDVYSPGMCLVSFLAAYSNGHFTGITVRIVIRLLILRAARVCRDLHSIYRAAPEISRVHANLSKQISEYFPSLLSVSREHVELDLGKPRKPASDGPSAEADLKDRLASLARVPTGALVADVAVAGPRSVGLEGGVVRRPLGRAGLEVRESHCTGDCHVRPRPAFIPMVAAAWARSARSITR